MDAKQFAWLYLVNEGSANARPSYYGGLQPIDDEAPYGTRRPNCNYTEWRVGYLQRIKDIGVDWDSTKSPAGRSYSQFDGTFADDSQVEHLTGKLVLKDGSVQQWSAAAPMGNVFDMMANFDTMKAKFAALFGSQS